jgi:diguanylate cyclase with GGDEF domain/PAS domain-containing protein
MEGDPARSRKSSDAANHYAARLLQHLVVPTFVIDADRRVVVWNRACERLTGITATEVLGTRNHWQAFYEDDRYCLADLVALGRLDLIGDLYSEFVATKDDSIGSSAENWCMMPRLGNHLYLAIDAGPILDDDGNLIAVVETLRDMTEQKRAEMALKTLAAKDALTGLANRRSFDQAIEIEWARADRSGRPLALLFADVDHFKLFNDNHGHQRGVRHHHARHRHGGRERSGRAAAPCGDGNAHRARRTRRRRGRHPQRGRCHLYSGPGSGRAGLADRPGRPGVVCGQASGPQPGRLHRQHAAGAGQGPPQPRRRQSVAAAQGARLVRFPAKRKAYRTVFATPILRVVK